MNKYISHIGNGVYNIDYYTDNKDNYKVVQEVIRYCIDGKDVQEKLDWSDTENIESEDKSDLY